MATQLKLTIVGEKNFELPPLDLEASPEIQVGRNPEAHVFLNDTGVSRRHCRLFVDRGRVILEDLGSGSGTILNGRPLSRPHPIKNGDEISLGGAILRVGLDPQTQGDSPMEAIPDAGHLPGDVTIVARKGQPRANLQADAVAVAGAEVNIGRDPASHCWLDSPLVSRAHARLVWQAGQLMLEDLASANGTFVNGLRVNKPRPINAGDVVSIGPFRMTYDGQRLVPRPSLGGVRLDVCKLGKVVKDRQNGQPLWLLRGIDLTILPREFVGLLGGSGCGKSTFMDTVNGRRPATHGIVEYDGENLYERFDSLKSTIGYVPQDVIFHDSLPVADALRYSALLRLPGDTTAAEIESNIDRVLKTVGLTERRATLVRELSGGQKKRVSIAMELLSRPPVLFLDEVTSGLDLGTERQMMQLFRMLADDGMTVVCITHHVDSLEMTDVIAYFVKGRLAFFGQPDTFKEHFGLEQIRDIYGVEALNPPEEWERKFKESRSYRQFVRGRAAQNGDDSAANPAVAESLPAAAPGGFVRQFRVLTSRYVKLQIVEYRNVALMLGLAPAVALLLCMVATSIGAPAAAVTPEELMKETSKQGLLCFGAIIIVLFLALFGAVREIVKEITIYRHERFINLRVLPYLLSKILPLAVIGTTQALLVTAILNMVGGLNAGSFGFQFGVLALTSVVGTVMGLAISAAVPTSDWATLCMIGIVIPEILYSGALAAARGVSGWFSKILIAAYWARRSLLSQLPENVRLRFRDDDVHPDAWKAGVTILAAHVFSYVLLSLLFMLAKDGIIAKWRNAVQAIARPFGAGNAD